MALPEFVTFPAASVVRLVVVPLIVRDASWLLVNLQLFDGDVRVDFGGGEQRMAEHGLQEADTL